MSNRDFLEWLEQQDRYWINQSKVEEKFPDLELAEMGGVTAKKNDEGDLLIPKRDYRKAAQGVMP